MQYARLALALLVLGGCTAITSSTTRDRQAASTQNPTAQDPTQLGTRQLEVRILDVPFDTAYRAATQAFFSIGYSITHSDKASGILTGTRTVGVTEMRREVQKAREEARQYQEQAQQEQIGRSILGLIPYVGLGAVLLPGSQPPPEREITEPSTFVVTMLLQPGGEKQTQIRFKMQKDGEPVWDQVTIDRLWVTTQREAMMEEGEPPSVDPSVQKSTQPTQEKVAPKPKPTPAKTQGKK